MKCYYANLMNLELFNRVTFPSTSSSEKLVVIRYFNEDEQNMSGENMEFELFLEVFEQLDDYTAKMIIFQVNCDKDRV